MSVHISQPPAQRADTRPTELLGSLSLRYDPKSASLARRFVKIALTAGGHEALADAVELVVSELVTNSVVHARPTQDDGLIQVRLLSARTVVRLDVHDSDRRMPLPRLVKPGDEAGRGMYIIESIVTNRGFYRSGPGKCVWCEFRTMPGSDQPG
ncbi:ATP-binding protein [Streptomyces sp. URMC 129]|uniref:ATP-binding protein n=1 Tax=Streptomyces sp. URMC 129 TaxID=3423407 RepID=UPI003F1ACCD1